MSWIGECERSRGKGRDSRPLGIELISINESLASVKVVRAAFCANAFMVCLSQRTLLLFCC